MVALTVVNKRRIYHGYHDKKEDAIAARKAGEARLFGRFSPRAKK